MLKQIFCAIIFFLTVMNCLYAQDDVLNSEFAMLQKHPELQKSSYSKRVLKPKELSAEAKKALEAQGFRVLGLAPKLVSPRKDSLQTEKEIVRVCVSFDMRSSGIRPTYREVAPHSSLASAAVDTIMTDGFEGAFPGTTWQRSGDPTWGKTNYQKHSGSYSVWSAKDSTKGVEPGQGYPNDCRSMMIYGPFALTDVNYAQLKFRYWLDTEYEKDWFYCMTSTDGTNFKGIGVSGETGGWEEDMSHLSNVPGLGNATGRSQVWIAFLFESDGNTTSDIGAFLDDVILTKRQIAGTPISGALAGTLTPMGNPYIAVGDVGVLEEDSLRIEPGVEIRFDEGCEFIVLGLLKAIGSQADSIMFTSNGANLQPYRWKGIILYSAVSNSSRIQYCHIENAQDGITLYSAAEICNNWINNNDYGINLDQTSGSLIKQNNIAKNYTGIYCILAQANILENYIALNSTTGIDAGLFYELYIKDNIIEKNIFKGINAGPTTLVLIHNTINNNGSNGIYMQGYWNCEGGE